MIIFRLRMVPDGGKELALYSSAERIKTFLDLSQSLIQPIFGEEAFCGCRARIPRKHDSGRRIPSASSSSRPFCLSDEGPRYRVACAAKKAFQTQGVITRVSCVIAGTMASVKKVPDTHDFSARSRPYETIFRLLNTDIKQR